jgi:hypothetical protein
MKKITSWTRVALVAAILLLTQNLFAQWTGSTTTSGNISRGGNVGIGITNPTSPLHIMGAVPELNLLIQNSQANGARTFLSAFPGKSSIQTDKDFTISTTGGGTWSDKFILTNSGYVGIGTSIVPQNPLEIVGVANEVNLLIRNNGSNGARTYLTSFLGKSSIQTDKDFTISTTGGGTWSDKFVLTNAGNVGIGTVNPQSLLAVNGTITSKEVNVTLTGWSDYVFHTSYNLRPLSQVESFIKENKHLPEIPSAKEVEANGVNLGEMDALLLKKIEELTLYMIEMKKENEEMKKENKLMKQEIQLLKTK